MPLWERLMDLADTMVSSKTQWSTMSDDAAAISLLLAESVQLCFQLWRDSLEEKQNLPHKLMYIAEKNHLITRKSQRRVSCGFIKYK